MTEEEDEDLQYEIQWKSLDETYGIAYTTYSMAHLTNWW